MKNNFWGKFFLNVSPLTSSLFKGESRYLSELVGGRMGQAHGQTGMRKLQSWSMPGKKKIGSS